MTKASDLQPLLVIDASDVDIQRLNDLLKIVQVQERKIMELSNRDVRVSVRFCPRGEPSVTRDLSFPTIPVPNDVIDFEGRCYVVKSRSFVSVPPDGTFECMVIAREE